MFSSASTTHHPLVQLARATIAAYVQEGRLLKPTETPAPIEGDPAGVFVTIHIASSGDLRGCIGTIEPTEASPAQETIRNAIAAATRETLGSTWSSALASSSRRARCGVSHEGRTTSTDPVTAAG